MTTVQHIWLRKHEHLATELKKRTVVWARVSALLSTDADSRDCVFIDNSFIVERQTKRQNWVWRNDSVCHCGIGSWCCTRIG